MGNEVSRRRRYSGYRRDKFRLKLYLGAVINTVGAKIIVTPWTDTKHSSAVQLHLNKT